jgi:hypothetical protein
VNGAPPAKRTLGVLVDGTPMPPDDARTFWERFSAHMEANKGDLAGFAKAEGFASVHPSMKDGAPVLLASRSAAQRPYAPVGKSAEGGSMDHQGSPRDPAGGGGKRGKHAKRRR